MPFDLKTYAFVREGCQRAIQRAGYDLATVPEYAVKIANALDREPILWSKQGNAVGDEAAGDEVLRRARVDEEFRAACLATITLGGHLRALLGTKT